MLTHHLLYEITQSWTSTRYFSNLSRSSVTKCWFFPIIDTEGGDLAWAKALKHTDSEESFSYNEDSWGILDEFDILGTYFQTPVEQFQNSLIDQICI